MKEALWDTRKNEWLKRNRGVSFEELLLSTFLMVRDHPSINQQELMLFYYDEYVWVVPFKDSTTHRVLKTAYSSRKYTKLYKEGRLL